MQEEAPLLLTATIAAAFVVSIVAMVVTYSVRRRLAPDIETFGLITEGLAKRIVTDDDQPYLYSRSNEQQMSVFGQVWYDACLMFPDQASSRVPVTANVGAAALVVIRPHLDEWADTESLLIVKLRTRLDSATFNRLKGARSANRSYAMTELTKEVITWSGSLKGKKYLALELLAPSFTVAGSVKQRQPLGSAMSYVWSIVPNTPGKHRLGIGLCLENEDATASSAVGVIERAVIAASHGLMSERNVDITLKAVQIIAAVLGILLASRTLGIFD